MSDSIDFFTSPMSRGRMVHWMLEEAGAPYTPHLINLEKGEQKGGDYLSINPMGKVPAIRHRGVVITEVPAIITYLGDVFPAAGLAPVVNDPQRGAYLRWMFFGVAVDYAIVDKMLERPPASRPMAVGYGNHADVMNVLEAAISETPYLLGERFTAADVYIGSEISFGLRTKAIEPRPAFQSYLARVNDRPASKRVGEISERWTAELKARA
jgi:glutathione S-transferase